MKRQFWGFVLIFLGVLALLQATHMFYFGLEFWPVVLTVVGASILWDGVTRKPHWVTLALGLWVGGMGLFDILSNAGVTTVTGGDIARNGWPLLLVAVGLKLLFGKRMGWRAMRFSGDGLSRESKSHIVGEMRYGQGSWVLDRDLNLEHGVGDVKVDLTTADITEGVHQINVNAWVGEVLIRVPDNVSVTVDCSANIGELEALGDRRNGMSLSLQRTVLVPESKVELKIDARLGIGSLRIVQRPPVQRITL